jgi:hypothetical protein
MIPKPCLTKTLMLNKTYKLHSIRSYISLKVFQILGGISSNPGRTRQIIPSHLPTCIAPLSSPHFPRLATQTSRGGGDGARGAGLKKWGEGGKGGHGLGRAEARGGGGG